MDKTKVPHFYGPRCVPSLYNVIMLCLMAGNAMTTRS